MNDYQKELWKKRQEYELAHKDNSKLPVKPKKKKKKVKSNTDKFVTEEVKQTTKKVTKDAKNKAHTHEFSTTTDKIRKAKKAKEAGNNIISKTRNKVKKKAIKHSDLYLAHHGVEGQKWGKRNGPPYPLDSSISTGHSLKKKNKGVKDGSAPGPYGGTRHTAKELKASIKAKKKTGQKLTDEERLYRNTRRGAMVGGLVGGAIAGAVTNRKIKKEHENEELKKEVREKLEEYRNNQNDTKDGGILDKVNKAIWTKHTNSEKYKEQEAQRKKEREEAHKKEMEKYKDPEYRKKKYADAKNNDMWDYAFLEAYQLNGKGHEDDENWEWNQGEALKEYQKYLKDPDAWLMS